MKLEGRAAIVTGGGRGIGQGIALALAGAGADVAINYRRDEAAAKETVGQIQAMGRRSLAFHTDVTDYPLVEEMCNRTIDVLGKVDILVCNAGVASRGHYLADTDVSEMHRLLNIHLFGALHFARALIPHMRSHERADVHLISSAATLGNQAGHVPYATAKACLETLGRCMAKEERRYGTRVNVIAPGLVETELGRRLVRATVGVENIKELYPQYPFGRICQPSDIGNLCVFLASEEGEYISGHVIYLDGGESL
ncbi:MAG: SDR family NAD(P)-dependent oxidoreductase [Dehalococcoidia bacterium]